MALPDTKSLALKLMGYIGVMNEAELQFWLAMIEGGGMLTVDGLDSYTASDGSRYARVKVGSTMLTADGNTVSFVIPHGASANPVYANVTPNNANAIGNRFVTMDATNITVTYDTPPAPGELDFSWVALI